MPNRCDLVGPATFRTMSMPTRRHRKGLKCGTLTYDPITGRFFACRSLQAQKAGVRFSRGKRSRLRTRDGAARRPVRKRRAEAVRDVECGNGVVVEHSEHWETHIALASAACR